MHIEHPVQSRTVQDYDIIFESGMVMPITVDATTGDTITIDDLHIKIYLGPKPALDNPERLLPEERITVYVSKVASIQQRSREVVELTPDQREEWNKFLKEQGAGPSPTIN
jgi:hypothetical protein